MVYEYSCSDEGGPLSVVQYKVVKKEYQWRGAVHWHMWVKPVTAPSYPVMAEMPLRPNTDDERVAYLRKIVECSSTKHAIPHAAFVEVMGKHSKCKYRFPFKVPEPEEHLDDDGVRYLYVRKHKEDALVQSRDSSFMGCCPQCADMILRFAQIHIQTRA